ncbi:MAG: hypothetical protein AAB511_01545 [Patescibacteria group bacterium]
MNHLTHSMEHKTCNIKNNATAAAPAPWYVLHGTCSMPHASFCRGVSLVEVVVSVAILFITVTGLLTAYNFFVRAGTKTLATVQASYLLEEGVEAASVIRDYGWTTNIANLSVGTSYYLVWSSSRWILSTTPSKIDNTYTRYLVFDSVNRDSNDAIASSGTNDSGTRKLSVYVSWPDGSTTTLRSISTYITNLFNN